MGRLLVTAICSVDGYVADTEGSFEFAFPTAEVHQAVNDLERGVGTPVVALFSSQNATIWRPLGERHTVLQTPLPCACFPAGQLPGPCTLAQARIAIFDDAYLYRMSVTLSICFYLYGYIR